MKLRKKKILKFVAFAIIGGLLGFAYYYFVGCKNGTCAITSSWYNSVGIGTLFGFLFAI